MSNGKSGEKVSGNMVKRNHLRAGGVSNEGGAHKPRTFVLSVDLSISTMMVSGTVSRHFPDQDQ